MAKQPIPLRKVPLIAKWSPNNLANLLTKVFEDGSYLLTVYEWIEGRAARTVPPSTMEKTLAGLDTAPDTHSKVAKFPAWFFVWSDDLKAAYDTYHYHVTPLSELDTHDAFDMDPSTHQYNDLLSECPDFTSNPYLTGGAPPTKQELNRQKNQDKYARWQARADDLKKINPNMTGVSIANRIAKEPVGEENAADTIRKNITI